jgi:hypothetical protein
MIHKTRVWEVFTEVLTEILGVASQDKSLGNFEFEIQMHMTMLNDD